MEWTRFPEDYEKDGLLYCGKCQTRKQTVFMGETIPCSCQCTIDQRDAEAAAWRAEQNKIKIKEMRLDGMKDRDLWTQTFARDDRANPKLSDVCRRYTDNFDEMRKGGKGLLLYGSVGTGKTFMAACIANALIDKGVPCLCTSFPKILDEAKGTKEGRRQFIDGLTRYTLLVIDDLGVENKNNVMDEVVYSVIDARYRDGQPMIVTTNLTPSELGNPADIDKRRSYSRILEMCLAVEVDGEDRRRRRAKEDRKRYSELLGL